MKMKWGNLFGTLLYIAQVVGPIAERIYAAAADPARPDVTPKNAPDQLVAAAQAAGIPIGHSEAQVMLSGIHLATQKEGRMEEIEKLATGALGLVVGRGEG